MPTPWKVLCASLATSALLVPPQAEARFGKHSARRPSGTAPRPGPGGGNSDGGGGGPGKSTGTSGDDTPHEHRATPIGQRDEDGRPEDAPVRPRARSVRSRIGLLDFAVAVFVGRHTRARVAPAARVEASEDDGPVPLMVRLGVQGDRLGDAGALDFFMAMDGARLGTDTRVTGLALPADDGTDAMDRLTLLSAHLTATLASSDRGRFRIEGGVASVHAPDVLFVGPSFAASAEACVGRSALDVEARLQATPFPYRQVDAQAGLALHLGALNLRGGWRGLFLDDVGLVDGIHHRDAFAGPYLGLGLAF